MIRAVLGLFAFAVLLCAYIVIKPTEAPVSKVSVAGTDVTRAAPQSLLSDTPLTQPEITEDVVALVPAPRPEPTPAPVPAPAPQMQVQTDDTSISATAANVLAGLGLKVDAPIANPEMAEKTTDVLANIGGVTGRTIEVGKPSTATALENLVVAALKEGRPDAEIDAMVNSAAGAGELTVPEVLVTSDGRVDTAILLQTIITEARIAAGEMAPAVPDVPTGDGTGVEVRVVQRATETQQYRFYTVNRGDSLGAIAIKFYGNVNKFQLIFEANRGILSSPDQIRVGQRLAIPNLSDA